MTNPRKMQLFLVCFFILANSFAQNNKRSIYYKFDFTSKSLFTYSSDTIIRTIDKKK